MREGGVRRDVLQRARIVAARTENRVRCRCRARRRDGKAVVRTRPGDGIHRDLLHVRLQLGVRRIDRSARRVVVVVGLVQLERRGDFFKVRLARRRLRLCPRPHEVRYQDADEDSDDRHDDHHLDQGKPAF